MVVCQQAEDERREAGLAQESHGRIARAQPTAGQETSDYRRLLACLVFAPPETAASFATRHPRPNCASSLDSRRPNQHSLSVVLGSRKRVCCGNVIGLSSIVVDA